MLFETGTVWSICKSRNFNNVCRQKEKQLESLHDGRLQSVRLHARQQSVRQLAKLQRRRHVERQLVGRQPKRLPSERPHDARQLRRQLVERRQKKQLDDAEESKSIPKWNTTTPGREHLAPKTAHLSGFRVWDSSYIHGILWVLCHLLGRFLSEVRSTATISNLCRRV